MIYKYLIGTHFAQEHFHLCGEWCRNPAPHEASYVLGEGEGVTTGGGCRFWMLGIAFSYPPVTAPEIGYGSLRQRVNSPKERSQARSPCFAQDSLLCREARQGRACGSRVGAWAQGTLSMPDLKSSKPGTVLEMSRCRSWYSIGLTRTL